MPDDKEQASGRRIDPSSQNEAVAFATTHWSVVLEAQGESAVAQEALESLCRTYWRPIYTFARREGIGPEEAKDITQGFFALILERKDFQSVRQEKGRLRSFLLASLKHFMANERRDAATIKRFTMRLWAETSWRIARLQPMAPAFLCRDRTQPPTK